ncbi:hypothetical protein WR25_19260 [Diploscapter pachys]|uniref:TIL domain-containing protein n=1 Tax=Diploscapter pachys TaxID=2018661 RepID=A0A2A2L7D5_9BILA|nr:hypothetical protein WR25_19260 [Diploscapter pachys]
MMVHDVFQSMTQSLLLPSNAWRTPNGRTAKALVNRNVESCIEICLTGCKCKSGFKLSKDGSRCVNSCDEEDKCNMPNEEWDDCGSGCGESTCADKPSIERMACPAICRPGCYCARGWVRQVPGGACIRSCSSLPPLIPLNVIAATAPSSVPARKKRQADSRPGIVSSGPMLTCANVRCIGKCVDTEQGPKCVAPEVTEGPATIQPPDFTPPTPQECMENAEWSTCVSSCEPQCGQPDDRICNLMCRTGCKCSDGFKLSKDGKSCVRSCDEDNSNGDGYTDVAKNPRDTEKQCPVNELWSNCHSACEPSCEQPFSTVCTLQCKMGCGCLSGFFRNSEGRCVTLPECKTNPPTDGPSCETVDCAKDHWCEMVDTTSGNQVPMCITKNACAATTCIEGEECRLLQVQCIKAPCDAIAQCVKLEKY